MHDVTQRLEAAVWAVAEGRATANDVALLEADPTARRRMVALLIGQTERNLESVRRIEGPEREMAVADFEDDLARLQAIDDRPKQPPVERPAPASDDLVSTPVVAEPPGEVRLHGSWASGQVVVWAAGPKAAPAGNDDLADRLEAAGAPALGWELHPPVSLPSGIRADAVAIPLSDSLGWLVAVGGM